MQLDVQGHPIHTRALAVSLAQRADGKLDVHGYVLDLRKRGFVPLAGDLQGSGIIHHMTLKGIVDPDALVLETIAAQQLSVAFEPSAVTEGEQCRDPIAAVEALAGRSLDAGFSRRVSQALGGPRGCSHILTLAHLLGSSAAWALERDRALHPEARERPVGQRVFRRDLIIGGYEAPEGNGTILLAIQLADLHFAPTPPVARPMERFAADREIRGHLTIEFPTFALRSATLAERTRTAADFEQGQWSELADTVADLAGLHFGYGVSGELLRRFGERMSDRPLLDTLLMAGPALIQCAGAMSDSWPAAFRASDSLVGVGALADSCYMWRTGGALARAREAEGGQMPVRPPVARAILGGVKENR